MEKSEQTTPPGDASANVLAGLEPPAVKSKPADGDTSKPKPEATGTATPPPVVQDEKVSKADMEKAIKEAIAADRKDRESQSENTNTRERFIRDKMNDLPVSVQNLMPKSGDTRTLAQAEQSIRSEMKDWFESSLKKAGYKPRDVGFGDPGGISTGQTGTASNNRTLNNTDLVIEGLKRARIQQD